MKALTPVKSIRKYCLECCNLQPKEVKNCPALDCPLFNFRLGKNPNRNKIKENLRQDNL